MSFDPAMANWVDGRRAYGEGEPVGANWQLVCGAALHWGSLLYQGVEFSPSLISPIDGSRVITPISVLAAIVFSLLSQHLENHRVRVGIVAVSVASGIAYLALSFVALDPASPMFDAYCMTFALLAAVNITVPVLLWGYAFASLDKRTAGHNAIYTALAAFVLAMVIALISQRFSSANSDLNVLARCVSGIVLIKGNVYFSKSSQPLAPHPNVPRMVRFYGGRLLMGIAIGTLLAAVPGALASPWLMGIEIAVCLGLLGFLSTRGRGLVCELVPVAPIALAVLLWFPFADAGDGVCGSMGFLVIWLSWLFVSSFQLSGLKDSLGMSGAFLSVSEKAALLGGWLIGLYIGNPLVGPQPTGLLPFVAVAATLIWATASSLRTVYGRQEDDFADRANRERAEYDARVLAELRDRFDLTAREAEVALMLSRGHSRPGICSQLGISEGTVRAHSSHIYTKLDVHRRDELILAVQAIEEDIENC